MDRTDGATNNARKDAAALVSSFPSSNLVFYKAIFCSNCSLYIPQSSAKRRIETTPV